MSEHDTLAGSGASPPPTVTFLPTRARTRRAFSTISTSTPSPPPRSRAVNSTNIGSRRMASAWLRQGSALV